MNHDDVDNPADDDFLNPENAFPSSPPADWCEQFLISSVAANNATFRMIQADTIVAAVHEGCSDLVESFPHSIRIRAAYDELKVTRVMHHFPRFGASHDIATLTRGTEGEVRRYNIGVRAMGIVIWAVVTLWACVLLYLYFYQRRKLFWMVGLSQNTSENQLRSILQPQDPPNHDDDDDADIKLHPTDETGDTSDCKDDNPPTDSTPTAENQVESFPTAPSPPEHDRGSTTSSHDNTLLLATYQRRLFRARCVVLFAAFLVLAAAFILFAISLPEFIDCLRGFDEDIPELRYIFGSANAATSHYLEIVHNESHYPQCVADFLTELYPALNDTLAAIQEINTAIDPMNGTLTKLYGWTNRAQDTVDDVSGWVYMMVILFAISLAVLTLVFAASAILPLCSADPSRQSRLFVPFVGSKALSIVFGLLTSAFWFLATTALHLSVYMGDLCYGDPDDQVVRLINADNLMNDVLEWYFEGCLPDLRPDVLFHLVDLLGIALHQVEQVLLHLSTRLRGYDPGCDGPNSLSESMRSMSKDLDSLLILSAELASILNCPTVAPHYSHLAYDTVCTDGMEAAFWIFVVLTPGCFLCMILLTLRASWAAVEAELQSIDDKTTLVGSALQRLAAVASGGTSDKADDSSIPEEPAASDAVGDNVETKTTTT